MERTTFHVKKRPPRIFYSEKNKKFYIKVKGRRHFLDIEFLKGLTKEQIRLYLTQLVIKKRKYHMRVKKAERKAPEVSNDVSRSEVKRMEKPTTSIQPPRVEYIFAAAKAPSEGIRGNITYKQPLLSLEDKPRSEATDVSRSESREVVPRVTEQVTDVSRSESREERADVSRNERVSPPRISDLQQAITEQLSKLRKVQKPKDLEQRSREQSEQEREREREQEQEQVSQSEEQVEELPPLSGDDRPTNFSLTRTTFNLTNKDDLSFILPSIRADLVRTEPSEINITKIYEEGGESRINFRNKFIQLFPEEATYLKPDKQGHLSKDAIVKYWKSKGNNGNNMYRWAANHLNYLLKHFKDASPISRNFVFNILYDDKITSKKIDKLFQSFTEEGGLTYYGDGHFNGYKDGLYDHEIQEIMMEKTNKFIPVIMSDQIPTLLPYVSPKTKEFSFIINTEDSKKLGEHWIAVFIDAVNHEINYFDPLVENPPTLEFLRDMKLLIDKMRSPYLMKMKINEVKVQDDNTSNCGFFCCRFLVDRYNNTFRDASGYMLDMSKEGEREIEKWKTYL